MCRTQFAAMSQRLVLALTLLLGGCGAIIYNPDMQYGAQGRYDKVIEYLEAAEGKGEKLTSMRINTLCTAYYQTKDYERTLVCLDRLQASIDAGDNSWLGLDIRYNAAGMRNIVLVDLGRYGEALAGSRAMLAQLPPRDYRRRQPIISAGLACALSGDMAGARRYAAEYEDMRDTSTSLAMQAQDVGLAPLYIAMRDGPTAYAVLRRAKDDATSALLRGVVYAVSGDKDIFGGLDIQREFLFARTALLAGKNDEARERYDKLLGNPLCEVDGYIHWQMLADRGRIAVADGQHEAAVGYLSRAVEIIETQRRTIGSEASKIGFVGDKQGVYGDIVASLLAAGRQDKAFEYAERAKARALVDLLAERGDLAPQDQAGAAETLAQLAGLERQYVRRSASADVGESARLRSALSGLRRDMDRKAPELASLVTVSAPGAPEIQAGLAPDETLLEYYGQGDALFAFVVTRESVRAVRLDGRGLEAEVRALREAVAQGSGEAWRQPARRLYDRLLAPVPGALDKPRLVIVSHGPLHYLPFAALHDGSRFLAERVALTFLPSAGVRRFLAARQPAATRSLLLLGNPDLGDKAFDLPGAQAEARAIKGIWPDSTVLLRKAATKSALTRAGGLFRVIHVAAHGEFVAEQPLASRLLLAPEGADDGRLTAGDLYALRLPADLVTLSACETGLGQVLSGDDVIGLTRGFLYAGAGSVVASLWPVSDAETQFLMTGFYRSLKTQPKADALRQAQLETLRRYPHPFYWSAFQLTGMGR